ncbi:MAG: radical SAM protein [Sulfurimonas sp.]|uniref:radical SAM/SPASM domain-containing protein n=1 Tax=Sulfurimonas sp. TaxID=2022749 RepID=UPI0025CFF137|nr:radical SAM/SPASM domain-containing protein [Sulfurimonas sp.]MCK9491394.1 radical SAM protein [Sulfurimonas sp.]
MFKKIKNKIRLKELYYKEKLGILKPKEIIIDIAAYCNAECPFCPRIYMPEERSHGYMKVELFKEILKKAKDLNINKMRLYSTAEPLLHPKFSQIISIAKEMDFFIEVSTNASMLHKYHEILLKVDVLQFSIEGWDKESYEKYRIPLKFEKIYNNIKSFSDYAKNKKVRPKIMCNLLLTKKTEVKKYLELWGEYVDKIAVNFMSQATLYDNKKFISKKNNEIKDEYYSFRKIKSEFMCSYPFTSLVVSYDGKISLCCSDFFSSLDLGYIDESIKSIWNNKERKKIREEFYSQKLDKCSGCTIFHKPFDKDKEKIKSYILSLDSKHSNKLVFGF